MHTGAVGGDLLLITASIEKLVAQLMSAVRKRRAGTKTCSAGNHAHALCLANRAGAQFGATARVERDGRM
jgi:hypothetical protein